MVDDCEYVVCVDWSVWIAQSEATYMIKATWVKGVINMSLALHY